MRRFIFGTLLSAFLAAPAFAFEFDTSKLSVGASYGFGNDGVLSGRLDYDISEEVEKPVTVRVGFDRYTLDFGGFGGAYSWAYNVFYGGAYYDFSEALDLGEKIHPFAGLGFGFGSVSCSGSFCNGLGEPSVGGLYYIGGVQYEISDQLAAEASFSAFGGLSIGVNYSFQ